MGASNEHSASSFCTFLREIAQSDIIVIINVLRPDNGMVGTGFVGYQAGHQIFRKKIQLGPNLEAFDAEPQATLAGTFVAIAPPTIRFASNLWIFLHNVEMALRLFSSTTESYQATFKNI